MLIANATLRDGARIDLRCRGGVISAMAPRLARLRGEAVIDAGGGAILPGLHDHHFHLFATAAARASVDCRQAASAAEFAALLHRAVPQQGWIRAIQYDEALCGDLSRAWLDRHGPDVKIRVQHRTGRLWVLNSRALAALAHPAGQDPLERVAGAPTGRLYDADAWLRARIGGAVPDVAELSAALARRGVTGLTDASANNDAGFALRIAALQRRQALHQRVAIMGTAGIAAVPATAMLFPAALKLHLHDGAYPDFAETLHAIQAAREAGLRIAVHCVTESDLAFTLALAEEAGTGAALRIEHAAIVPDGAMPRIAALGACIVTQPNFIAERGDRYLRDVPARDHAHLYRCATLRQAGIPVAFSTDAPYGAPNPWAAMQAAVERRSARGHLLGGAEIVTPEQALDMFLAPLHDPAAPPRRLAPGARADICVLAMPWAQARRDLGAVRLRATLCGGRPVFAESQETGRKVA